SALLSATRNVTNGLLAPVLIEVAGWGATRPVDPDFQVLLIPILGLIPVTAFVVSGQVGVAIRQVPPCDQIVGALTQRLLCDGQSQAVMRESLPCRIRTPQNRAELIVDAQQLKA